MTMSRVQCSCFLRSVGRGVATVLFAQGRALGCTFRKNFFLCDRQRCPDSDNEANLWLSWARAEKHSRSNQGVRLLGNLRSHAPTLGQPIGPGFLVTRRVVRASHVEPAEHNEMPVRAGSCGLRPMGRQNPAILPEQQLVSSASDTSGTSDTTITDRQPSARNSRAGQPKARSLGRKSLVRSLEAADVDVVFGIPGGRDLPPTTRSWTKSVRHILVRHERGARPLRRVTRTHRPRSACALATSGRVPQAS